MSHIVGVEHKELSTFPDGRGFFREVLRESDTVFDEGIFGQWSHSKMVHNVVKAWHFHHRQTDWWYAPIGLLQVEIIDYREESPTFKTHLSLFLGEQQYPEAQQVLLRIPPGVLHAAKVLSDEAHLFYITSHMYDPDDEGRIPFDDPTIGFSWGSDIIVSERDTKPFTPPYPRTPLP